MRRAWWAVLLAVVTVTVAGCTGVPGSSGPDVVKTVGLGEPAAPGAPAPPKGADPRTIVQGFLDAMATSPDGFDVARAYLDNESAPKWNTSTVTVVKTGTLLVRSADPERNRVNVTYQSVGTLSATGEFSPVTTGQGVATVQPLTFTLTRTTDDQWRIRTPPAGLYITQDAFQQLYIPRPVYFLNLTGTRLVPDLRYSALTEESVDTFLLAQLTGQPGNGLANAVSALEPTPTGNQRLTVAVGSPTVVQVPGAAALDGPSRERLAAQLAFTLKTSPFRSELQIQDNKQVVQIPSAGATFDSGDFPDFAPVDDSESVTATFLRNGAVLDAKGTPVTGVLGTPEYGLRNAVFDSDGGRTLVAGTTDASAGDGLRLLVGDTSKLRDVGVPTGPLTSPAWAPIGTSSDVDEVWVASGPTIYRFVPGVVGATPTKVNVAGATAIAGSSVKALAFSPEGTRLALVIASGSTSQVYTASVVRNGPDVQLSQPVPITPAGYQVSDVGWLTDYTLAAVGSAPGEPIGVFLDFYVDGSRFSAASPDGLPETPRTLAVSPRGGADLEWVTVGTGSTTSVWTKPKSARSWTAPSGVASQVGYAPSFST